MYLDCEPTGRTKDNTLIVCVNQGFEPPQFTACFHPWNKDLWNVSSFIKDVDVQLTCLVTLAFVLNLRRKIKHIFVRSVHADVVFANFQQGKTFHEIIDDVGKENAGIALLEDVR